MNAPSSWLCPECGNWVHYYDNWFNHKVECTKEKANKADVTFKEITTACGTAAEDAGWWQDFPGDLQQVQRDGILNAEQHNWIGNKLLLICSEAVEAHDEIRTGHGIHDMYYDEKNKPQGFPTELADVVIRVMDMCYNLGINLPYWVDFKLTYNASRGHRHGNKVS